jgi:tetratricopeptide (TPR) repeat protein
MKLPCVLLLLSLGCSRPEPASAPPAPADGREATSLLGEPLFTPEIAPERRAALEANLAAAEEALARNPKGLDEHIWLGRRLAYLGRFRAAIAAYERGLALHPQSYRLLRHRGHRWITLREFERAIADLSRAAELAQPFKDEREPDGAPNERNVPTSTDKSNIYYHLGLAHYLSGQFQRAEAAWRECLKYSRVSDDMLVANAYWLALTLQRQGRRDEVRVFLRNTVRPGMDILENHAYYALVQRFQGEVAGDLLEGLAPEDVAYATTAYGLAAWALCAGRKDEAFAQFRKIVAGTNWAAFGTIAAEAELARGS